MSKINFDRKNIKHLSQAFTALINNEFMSDVRFHFKDEKSILAHSFILGLRSEKFFERLKEPVGMNMKH